MMRSLLRLSFLTIVPLGAAFHASASQEAVEMVALQDQAVERLRQYVRVDTINPPGNETRGVEFLAAILEAEGIEYETAESAPGRGNIWARIEGGDAPGLVLLHHIDVVPADAEHWSTDPLGAEERDGYLYGRGTMDTKTLGILHLQAFLALHRSGIVPDRDVVFMATADEEAGGFYGVGWLVENRPELFEGIGLVLNEGGGGVIEGDRRTFSIEVTQKVPLWLRLVAEGAPGHGSMPRVESAVTRLVRALGNVIGHDFEPRIVPAVGEYFRALAATAPDSMREAFSDMPAAVADRSFLLQLQLGSPFLHALTRNTCTVTVLQGSSKINTVPPAAAAELDCRLLPDEDLDTFTDRLAGIINDRTIRIDRIMGFTPAVSDADTDQFRTLYAALRGAYPQASVIPSVSTGFTDSHFIRDLGILAYGFDPTLALASESGRVHGNDERVEVEQVRAGTAIMLDVLLRLVGAR